MTAIQRGNDSYTDKLQVACIPNRRSPMLKLLKVFFKPLDLSFKIITYRGNVCA